MRNIDMDMLSGLLYWTDKFWKSTNWKILGEKVPYIMCLGD